MAKCLDLLPGQIINARFRVEEKLGEGGFGAVYQMREQKTDDVCAMKVEMKPMSKRSKSLIKMEVVVLEAVRSLYAPSPHPAPPLSTERTRHFCQILDQGRNESFRYIVMTLLGPSLSDLRKAREGQYFTLSTAVRASLQCLRAIQDLHSVGFIHRDIKPHNFAIGIKEKNEQRTIFLIDFGLSRQFVSNGEIKTPRDSANFRGTTRYAAIAAHAKTELSRKDDLEMWFYQQVEMTIGKLPWADMAEKPDVHRAKIAMRQNKRLFTGCPSAYAHMLRYIDGLRYWDPPDYEFVASGLLHIIKSRGINMNEPFNWEEDSLSMSSHSAHRPPILPSHGLSDPVD